MERPITSMILPPSSPSHKSSSSVSISTPSTAILNEGLRERQLNRLAKRSPPRALPVNITTVPSAAQSNCGESKGAAGADVAAPKTSGSLTSAQRKLGEASKIAGSPRIDSAHLPIQGHRLGVLRNTNVDSFSPGRRVLLGRDKKSVNDFHGSSQDGQLNIPGAPSGSGRLYLRPSIRPGRQRFAQNVSQPNAGSSGPKGLRDTVIDEDRCESPWLSDDNHHPNIAPTKHRRAYSHSTVDDHPIGFRDSNVSGIKLVVERPSRDGRPKTSGGGEPTIPSLEVPIPSYKLGRPRFSAHGTPFIRGSSYAPTENTDNRSSAMSRSQHQRQSIDVSGLRYSQTFNRASLLSGRRSVMSHPADNDAVFELRLPPTGFKQTTPNLMPRHPILPEMYDALSTPPMCEDRSVVRRNFLGQISAATPARLIAEVTQELAYDLVASFFITYRAYLAASDLLNLIMARLQHGINLGTNGLVITVRCFTVIRHWLVNFFIDDYVLDHDLRVQFCKLVNGMVEKQAITRANSKTTNDILSSIKRLWRDSCATYWDGPEFEVDLDALVPITPGGIAGSRDAHLTPSQFGNLPPSRENETLLIEHNTLSALSKPPALELDLRHDSPISSTRGFFASLPLTSEENQNHRRQQIATISSPQQPNDFIPEAPLSPTSMKSVEAFSCSFPLRTNHAGSSAGLWARPVMSEELSSNSPVTRGPKIQRSNSQRIGRNRSISNSSRPDKSHKRNGSGSIDDGATPVFVDRFAGSLIRGLVYLPPQSYLPFGEDAASRPSSLPYRSARTSKDGEPMSGGGKKKLFGKRGGSKPHGGEKSAENRFPHLSIALEQTAAVGCAAGAAALQYCFRSPTMGTVMRPDKLSLSVENDFEMVVEEHKVELIRAQDDSQAVASSSRQPEGNNDTSIFDAESHAGPLPGLLSASKDGWKQCNVPSHSSFLDLESDAGSYRTETVAISGTFNETRAEIPEARLPSAAPTPPVTPPDRIDERRGQDALSYEELNAPSLERTPSLVLGLRSPASDPESHNGARPMKHPRMRSFGRDTKSRGSDSLRRIASFQSGYSRHIARRSFGQESFAASFKSTHPPNNRTLKRRPGGNLRAADTIKDLPLRRPLSSNSMSTFASLRRSFRLGLQDNRHIESAATTRRNSTGTLAGAEPVKPRLSLLSTTSQPVMRPSFQLEARKLAQLPDSDDEGGVDTALLKLEGKYEKRKSDLSVHEYTSGFTATTELEFDRMFEAANETSIRISKKANRQNQVMETSPVGSLCFSASANDKHGESSSSLFEPGRSDINSSQTAGHQRQPTSEDFDISDIPLLERTDSQRSRYARRHGDWTGSSILLGTSRLEDADVCEQGPTSHPQSFSANSHGNDSFVLKTRDNTQGTAHTSFLRLEDDFAGDGEIDSSGNTSSVTSNSTIQEGNSAMTLSAANRTDIGGLSMQDGSRQFSRDFTTEQALGLLPRDSMFPPTPDGTPIIPDPRNDFTRRSWFDESQGDAGMNRQAFELRATGHQVIDEHLSFILSFPSSLLAQQFTLIEMEALNEIHFRELLEVRWSNDIASSTRSWPRFLQKLSKVEEDDSVSHGIEICAARSSIMASWAISQVVLTTDVEERAKTISKLVRIAVECRELGNYATVFQITVALTKPVLRTLSTTWSLVSGTDIDSLRELELLIQPANNFRRLRDEMEARLGKQPCIPLVAIYAKDLSALKAMPSYIPSVPGEPPLINVAKCRAQAAVVQLMARYLERSGEMRVLPVNGVVERCLWVGGLRDAEVKEALRSLE